MEAVGRHALPRNLQVGTVFALAAVTLLLLLVHNASPDKHFIAFPESCPPDKPEGCSRVADSNPHNAGELTPFRVETSRAELLSAARQWVELQPRMQVIEAQKDFLHARAVSASFGFADDMSIRVKCSSDEEAVLEVQGSLRIGSGDFGVNHGRNARLLHDMKQLQAEGQFPAIACNVGY